MTPSPNSRLKWACRRGMLELDLVLLAFFDEQFSCLSMEEQSVFEDFLAEADQDLYAWLLAFKPCPQQRFHPLLVKIRHHAERHLAA